MPAHGFPSFTIDPVGLALSWAAVVDIYTVAMQAGGRAPTTVRLHRHFLAQLSRQHPAGPWSVTTGDLQVFLSPAHWKPETRKAARSVVRGFYAWGHGMGHVETNPADTLATVRVPPPVPRPTPEHLVRQLVSSPDSRLGLMAMLAAYGGLRCAEIAQVHASDLVGDTLTVHGKGGKVRAVPVVYPRLLAELQALDSWAFPSPSGGHLASHTVSKLLSAALPAGWTAHTLRHRMATVAYHGTRDLLAVSAILGHSRPETTQRYVRLPDDAIRAAVAAAC